MKQKLLLLLFALMSVAGIKAQETEYFNMTLNRSNPGSTTILISYQYQPDEPHAIQYSTDKENWTKVIPTDHSGFFYYELTLSKGNFYYFRKGEASENVNVYFGGKENKATPHGVMVAGNIMSLVDRNFNNENKLTVVPERAFKNLFTGFVELIYADGLDLPVTTLSKECYAGMFSGCISLMTPPSNLPATTLADYCYDAMFYGCQNLRRATTLNATELKTSCYHQMYYGCSMLTHHPLPDATLAPYCYSGMFDGCMMLQYCPALPATNLANGCYENMFKGCVSIGNGPDLPATSLKYSCYSGMFSGCTGLQTIPELPAETLANNCYSYMFQGCTGLTSAVLPATTLTPDCYRSMFNGCKSLKSVTLAATAGFDSEDCLTDWLLKAGTHHEGLVHIEDAMAERVGELNLASGWLTDKVVLQANCDNTDPVYYNDYFTTFYGGNREFTISGEDVRAYIGTISKEVDPRTGKVTKCDMIMKTVANNVIPKGEPVIIRGGSNKVRLTYSETEAEKNTDNALSGTSIEIPAPDNCYIFTRGQKHVGFYQYTAGKTLTAHKAYLVYDPNTADGARELSMVFEDDETASISCVNEDESDVIFDLSGQRIDGLRKGINIVNGKKVFIK